jgi:RAB protein geranylgeranyltransferase component A
VNLLSLLEKISCHAIYENSISNLQMIILFILWNYVACMTSMRKRNIMKIMMFIRNFEKNDDKPSCMMPYNVSREVQRKSRNEERML